MRRVLISILVVAVLLAAGGGWWLVSRMTTTVRTTADAMANGVEAWAGTQIVRILNDLLRPELTVDSFRYEPPARITLNGVKLVDEGVEVITAATFVVELREVPKRGKPVVIESVRLEHPVIRLIPRAAGGLLGLSDMVETTAGRTYDDGGSSRPSDVFGIKRIEIDKGELSYEPANRPPMVLDGIDVRSSYDPDMSTPDVYHVDTILERPPLTSLSIKGDLNLDESWLRISQSLLTVDVEPSEYGVFPPAFQEFLRSTELRGHLTLAMTGMLPFTKDQSTDLTFDGELRDANVALGSYQLPMQHVTAKLRLGDHRLDVDALEIAAFRGTASVRGDLVFDDPKTTEVHISGSALHIEDALRTATNESPAIAGELTGKLDVTAGLANMPSSVDGSGEVSIANGKLWNDPAVSGLLVEFELQPDENRWEDHASCQLRLLGDLMQLRELECVSGQMGVRGEGELLYDRTMNLRVNAGPMEKAQNEMGPVGDFLGAITDSFVKYQITGPWGDPVVEVRPLGIGAEESLSSHP